MSPFPWERAGSSGWSDPEGRLPRAAGETPGSKLATVPEQEVLWVCRRPGCSGISIRDGADSTMKNGPRILILFAGVLSLAAGKQSGPPGAGNLPSIGLNVGQRAPAFLLSDQFGHQQSNETLKGQKGTLLLFFRSADW